MQYLILAAVELLLGWIFVSMLGDESPAAARVLSALGEIIDDVIRVIRRWWGVDGRHCRYEGRHVGVAA